MIPRDPGAEQEHTHDLIVVGGGVYGCMLALESARRGLRPLLLERDDFGQHTSGNWLRILHGGLRYLQTLDLRRHVESVRERRWWLHHFPDLVEPLHCVMPLYGRGLRRRPIMAGALAANDALSWYRNRGLRRDRVLPRGKLLSVEETLRLAPSVRTEGLTGAASWYDAVAPEPQRLMMEMLRWTTAEGARVANYVEVTGLRKAEGRVTGVDAHDRVADRTLTFSAPVVVNCAGPWAAELAASFDRGVPDVFRPSLAFNVLFDREPDFEGAWAVEAAGPGARTHFVHSAYGRVLAGTYHGAVEEGHGAGPPAPELVRQFAQELDDAMPGLDLASARVLHVFWGLLPVRTPGTVDLARRAVVHDHGAHAGPRGLFTVSGVKFTVAGHVARQVLAAVRRGGYARVLPAGRGTRPEPREWPDARAWHALQEDKPRDARALVVDMAETEAALTRDDVLFRRTAWGIDPRVARTSLRLVHEVLGRGRLPRSGS